MPKTLAEQLGPDTIVRFERAAPLRIEEGDVLVAKCRLTAIYLYGYAVEMLLKYGYFKNIGFGVIDEIDRDARNRAMAVARTNSLMSWDPHDIPGWARLLVWDKQVLHTPGYPAGLARKIVERSLLVYENWRPQMRYRNTEPSPKSVSSVRDVAKWFLDNYGRF